MIAAVILAAGASRRLGEPKPLVRLGRRTALEWTASAALEAQCDPVVAVIGHLADEVRKGVSLPAVRFVRNDGFGNGRTSSLKAGLEAVPDAVDGVMVFPVDHPLVQPRDVASLRLAFEALVDRRSRIVLPTCGGRRGHPVIFGSDLKPEILALGDDEPLHAVVRAHAADVMEIPLDNPGILGNLDTPEDVARAREAIARRHPSQAS